MAKLVVIGTSQGGLQALEKLVAHLPADFPAPLLAVQHIGRGPSYIPQVLERSGVLPADFARDGEEIEAGRIYIAPPDFHMRVNDDRIELSSGPRENWARPAIDPLFRSAAEFHGPDVIGVVLTGNLNDGTIGLYEIKRRGGIAIVQEPSEAEAPAMPRSALESVEVDYRLPLAEIPKLLVKLSQEPARRRMQGEREMTEPETRLDVPVAQTCPECGGAMRRASFDNVVGFKCHIGHSMTAEVLANVQLEQIEHSISAALRALNERANLCREMAAQSDAAGHSGAAANWAAAEREARERAEGLLRMSEARWETPEILQA
jgi:two-component system chemotaxis response regulator CheB